MKNRLLRKLFAITVSLIIALSLTACTPEVHILTDGQSSENSTVASTEKTTQTDNSQSKVDTSVASSEAQNTDTANKSNSVTSQDTSSSNTKISKSEAKEIALKDAGLKAADIYDYEIDLDYEKGVLHYEISFEYGGKDYDYDINAETGKIVSVDKPNATSSEVKISKSKAKSTALNHAGVKETDISSYQVELEKDNGVWKYEVSFRKGNVEYDYTINAETGKILESEKDIDD